MLKQKTEQALEMARCADINMDNMAKRQPAVTPDEGTATDKDLTMNAAAEMPKYECHKKVWALKIAAVEYAQGEPDTVFATITPADEGYASFVVDEAYLNRHKPEAGGYYVVYADGYKSFSPADAFESGYTRV